MKNLYFILIFFVSCTSSSEEIAPKVLKGTWLSTSYMADIDREIPYGQFMEFNDSSEVRYLYSVNKDSFQHVEFSEDSIKFPFRWVERSEIKLKDDVLSIGKNFPWKVERIDAKALSLDSSTIMSILSLGQWSSTDETLQFSQDRVLRYNHNSKKVEDVCWDLHVMGDYRFIQYKGNFLQCDGGWGALAIINQLSEDSISLTLWKEGGMKTLTYKQEKKQEIDYASSDFRLCNPLLYEHSRGSWYYFKYAGFESGLYGLQKVFDKRFRKVDGHRTDGLVRIQFVINCLGELGMLEAYEMTEEYEKTNLHPLIKSQILEILQTAGSWVPGERDGVKLDAFKYLIFRIKDGRIREIFP